MASNNEPSSLSSHVIDQWKLWAVAIPVAIFAAFMSTQAEGTFNAVWLGFLAVLIMLYALRKTGIAGRLLKRSSW